MATLEARLNQQSPHPSSTPPVVSDEELRTHDFFLTTSDNPHNPFTSFKEWFAFDSINGYNSSGLLARIAVIPFDLEDLPEKRAMVQAMQTIIRLNGSGKHRIAVTEAR